MKAKNLSKNKKKETVKSIVNLGKGFPSKVRFTHKYHGNCWITCTGGAMGEYKFICNGMFDPDYSGTGHQPYYFDQLSAIYDHYTVTNSRIMIRSVSLTASPSAPYYIALSQNDDTTSTPSNFDTFAEMSTGSVTIVPFGATTVKPLRNEWSARRVFGGDPLANDNLQGNATSNPTEQTVWVICARPCDIASTITVCLDVNIEYDAIWDEIKDVASS